MTATCNHRLRCLGGFVKKKDPIPLLLLSASSALILRRLAHFRALARRVILRRAGRVSVPVWTHAAWPTHGHSFINQDRHRASSLGKGPVHPSLGALIGVSSVCLERFIDAVFSFGDGGKGGRHPPMLLEAGELRPMLRLSKPPS